MMNFLRDTKLGRYLTAFGAALTVYSTTPVFSQDPDSTLVNVGGYEIPASWADEFGKFSEALKGNDEFLIGVTSKEPFYQWYYMPSGFNPKKVKESAKLEQIKKADVSPSDNMLTPQEFADYCTSATDTLMEMQRRSLERRSR